MTAMSPPAIDIANACYKHHPDPGVVLANDTSTRFVALFDAWGSWGSGFHAAAATRAALANRWQRASPPSMNAAIADVLGITHSIASPYSSDDFGCDFDAVLVASTQNTVEFAACGRYCVALVDSVEYRLLFEPRMLVDIAGHDLSPSERENVPYKDVCVGPYLAPGGPNPFERFGPIAMPRGSVLLVACRELTLRLLACGPANWVALPVDKIRQFASDTRQSQCPMVVVRAAG
jgi:hypothetical protein